MAEIKSDPGYNNFPYLIIGGTLSQFSAWFDFLHVYMFRILHLLLYLFNHLNRAAFLNHSQ